jgi:hypothetical protein
MALLGFKKCFALNVQLGKKRQSIRAKRKHPIKVGERLYLYTGLRTKAARKLGEGVAIFVEEIKIEQCNAGGEHLTSVEVAGQRLLPTEITELAIADGFPDAVAFLKFFAEEHTGDFVGDLIKWKPENLVLI